MKQLTANIWTRITAATEVVAAARALVYAAQKQFGEAGLAAMRSFIGNSREYRRLEQAILAYDATETT